MNTKILYLFTRTPLHVGAGSSVGAIDQPIIRERHTGFPVIPGSSIKGVLRDALLREDKNKSDKLFGVQDNAGMLAIGEAKLVAFPVRSAKGSFAFITCPLALERLRRAGGVNGTAVPDEPEDMTCLSGPAVTINRNNQKGVVLEEYKFSSKDAFPQAWETALLGLLDDPVWKIGKGRFVLLCNGDFSHFVKNTCEVSQHVAIAPDTGTAKPRALFNLEAVPAETLFFATVTQLARAGNEMEEFAQSMQNKPIIQLGGDSTTGLGFCSIKLS